MTGKVRVVTCPDLLKSNTPECSVFLAGGITGCLNWQQDFINLCKLNYRESSGLVLVNPRRDNFEMSNKDMSKKQIQWEYQMLRKCDKIIFWFPEETLCPITLFELGSALERTDRIMVGCSPGYKRLLDVEEQVSLSRPNIKICYSLQDLVQQLLKG